MTAEGSRPSRKAKKERRISLLRLTEAQLALSWGALLTLAALVGTIYLLQTSGIANRGQEVQRLQRRLDDTKQQNIELERDIAEAQSLDRLQQEALKLGFTRSAPGDVEYLVIPEYPEAPTAVATPEAGALGEPPENMVEALWLAITNSVGDLIHGKSP